MHPEDQKFHDALEAKKFLAHKADRKAQTEVLSKKLDELKPKDLTKVELVGAEIVTIKGVKGDKGDKGDTPSDEALTELITPLIPEPITGPAGKDSDIPGPAGADGKDGQPGKDGKDGIDGKDGLDGPPGLDGSPDSPKDVKDKLESLKGNKRLSIDAVRGFDKVADAVNTVSQSVSFLPRTLDAQYDAAITGTQNNNSLLQYKTSTKKWFNGVSLTVSATAPTDPKLNDLWVDIP